MATKPWTRNQKIAVWGVIAVIIMGVLGWFIKIDLEISYIQSQIEQIQIDKANIKSLVVDEFLKTCPPGTTTSTIEFVDEGIKFGCIIPE
ncbi:hypothetical protein KKA15_04990 [Patescibacteria group bacterium]|nr:hypothetical protein [Patescibacteria group bacterium]